MRQYRTVDSSFLLDRRIRSLPEDARHAFLLVLIHPEMTAVGVLRTSIGALADDLMLPEARLTPALERLERDGMLACDWPNRLLIVRNWLRYNEPVGPNSVSKAWVMAVRGLPECAMRDEVIRACLSYLDTRSEAFRRAILPGFWSAMSDAISDDNGHAMSDAKPKAPEAPKPAGRGRARRDVRDPDVVDLRAMAGRARA